MSKTRFKDFINVEPGLISPLPFIHITDGYNLEDILQPKELRVSQCKVFSADILYMFYGKPAYRTKHGGTNFLSCHLPCVFIFDPVKIKKEIKSVYPFDTGAFSDGHYSPYFHKKTELNDFLLDPALSSAQKVVEKFYQSNKEYFEGGSRKNVDLPSMNFEAEGYLELARVPSHPEASSRFRADERASAIELHFHDNVDLRNTLLAVVLPAIFLDLEIISDALEDIQPQIIKTYTSIHKLTYEGIAGKIYEIVENIYLEKGFL